MLYIIAIILAALWMLGLITTYTIVGLVHVLLVVALTIALLKLISMRHAL